MSWAHFLRDYRRETLTPRYPSHGRTLLREKVPAPRKTANPWAGDDEAHSKPPLAAQHHAATAIADSYQATMERLLESFKPASDRSSASGGERT